MTFSPFLQLPVAISGGQGPLVSLADCRPIFPAGIETDAYGQWDFANNDNSLASLIDGKALALNASAPTYYSDSLKIADGGLNGLLTDLDDRAAMTFCAVAKLHPGTGSLENSVLFNSSNATASQGGGMGYLSWGASTNLTINYQTRQQTTLASAVIPPGNAIVSGSGWVFLAFTRDDASPRTIYGGSLVATAADGSALGAKTLASPMRKVSIGNSYFPGDGTYYSGARLAEAIIFTGIKTTAELAAIAARSKARMLRKGIVLANV